MSRIVINGNTYQCFDISAALGIVPQRIEECSSGTIGVFSYPNGSDWLPVLQDMLQTMYLSNVYVAQGRNGTPLYSSVYDFQLGESKIYQMFMDITESYPTQSNCYFKLKDSSSNERRFFWGYGDNDGVTVVPIEFHQSVTDSEGVSHDIDAYGILPITKYNDFYNIAYSNNEFYCNYKIDDNWETSPNEPLSDKEDRGEDSEEIDSGGLGTDRGTTQIGVPELPEIDFSTIGYNLYKTDSDTLNGLMEYLWSDDFLDNIKKLYNDPMEAINGLYVADFEPDAFGNSDIQIGNVITDQRAPVCASFMHISCGSIKINEKYGSYGDYSLFNNISMYLPKVGVIEVDVDMFMNNTVYVDYNIDMLSGQGVCIVRLENNRTGDISIYATYMCQCMVKIPLSAKDSSEKYAAFLNATAGALTGGVSGVVNGAMNILGSKNHVVSNSSMGDMGSLMNHKKPYLTFYSNVITRPNNYNKFFGYKSPRKATLGSLTGFTKVEDAHINFNCPSFVKSDLIAKLKAGVIV